MHPLLLISLVLFVFSGISRAGSWPPKNSKIYGVNLGSWLVLEPWMLPQEWQDMGGETCSPCSDCIGSEFAFVEAYGDASDEIFDRHWSSWFTQDDVDHIVELGLNTVRIPLGYWIIESLVDRKTEFYPRGGMKHLRRGLEQLARAGIDVILDHHAPPGVQSSNEAFTGHCTTDVQFFTDYNYRRALVWTATMTALSHTDPAFRSVVSIEAVNEPLRDATQTPGYGQFQKDFVLTVRAVEAALGIGHNIGNDAELTNLTSSLLGISSGQGFSKRTRQVVEEAIPYIHELGTDLSINELFYAPNVQRQPLTTSFMDINWQFNEPRGNPRNAARGPQSYDNHLYYSFGGVADPNEEAYMQHICNLDRVERDAELGNKPLWFGEWAITTNFDASDEFLERWADAQKRSYSEGAGWIFWNFKVEQSELAGDLARQWSYFEGVQRGYLTKDPKAMHDKHVCDPYV